jgi:PPM family protein phosphatase
MFKIKSCALSDLGLKRKINEDSYCVREEKALFLIADGMGGHNAGEFASRLAVSTIENFIDQDCLDKNTTLPFATDKGLAPEAAKLVTAVKIANQTIYQKAKTQIEYRNMGSTVVALTAKDDSASIAHVGDSRAYRIRQNTIEQLTTDHSWIREQVQKGILTEEESKKHQLRNIITRALGIEAEVEVDARTEKIQNQDYLILCSDGLSSSIEDEIMKDIILDAKSNITCACRNLINAANEKGGKDNITVIIVYFEKIACGNNF